MELIMKYNRLKDNDFLTDLNMDNATDEQKITLLNRIIDNELKKNDADMDLIEECMAFIADLDGNKFQKTDSELNANLQKILLSENRKSTAVKTPSPKRGLGQTFRALSVLFAATLALAALLAIAANFFPTEGPAVSTTVSTQPVRHGDVIICIDGIETAAYSSVDALLQGENLHMQYPSNLPKGVELEQVDLWHHENDQMVLTLRFNTTNLQFQVCSNALFSNNLEGKQEMTHFTVGEFTFTLYHLNSSTYQAICTAGEYTYSVSCINYSELIAILNDLAR